ncbi:MULTISPECIES: hypothetical protein [unclassified Roseovarius]|uniref:hypothetical protein n=1 Tax=unclassified Roseovarius TaxID=2614913 RepID=UPI00273D062B|nr:MULTISPECIES: hypothetical protein [unclassified Roseovarius]
MTCLEQRLLEFDGKAVSCLSEAKAACGAGAGYLDDLVRLCFDRRPLVSSGATWILKAELEAGNRLGDSQRGEIVQALHRITSCQAALHLLQVADLLDLSAAEGSDVADWAGQYADHPRPFLRAWSLHSRVTLAHRFAGPGVDVQELLANAAEDEAASVRARAGKLRKALKLPEG